MCGDWLAQRWLAKYYSPPSSRRKTKWLLSVLFNKVTLWAASYSACVVYTETIIHLSVSESGGCLPPLRWIIVNYQLLLHGSVSQGLETAIFTNLIGWNGYWLQSSRSFITFLCRRPVGFLSRAFLVFLMKESKKRRQQPGKLMAKSCSQPVNLPSARPLMNHGNVLKWKFKIIDYFHLTIFISVSTKKLMRKKKQRGQANFGRIKFG